MKTYHPLRRSPALMMLAALAFPAFAQQTAATEEPVRYYGGLQIGRNNVSSWADSVTLGPGISVPGQLGTKAGKLAGLVLGRQSEKARWEVEYQRGDFKLANVEVGAVAESASGTGRYQALTANGYRLAPLGEGRTWTGYGALGLGWGRAELPAVTLSSACPCMPASSKSGLVFLARLGIDYRVTEDDRLFLQYSLLRMPGPASGTVPGVQYATKWIGGLGLGYRRLF